MIRAAKMLLGMSLLAIATMAAAAGTTAAQQGSGYSSYIALGDSFSSGVGASTWKPNDLCVRTDAAWTVLTRSRIGNLPFVHAACSGATAQDVLAQGPKYEAQGYQSQIALLPPPEQLRGALITIQVGGNDVRHESACLMGIKLLNGEHGPIPMECKNVEYMYNNIQETVAALASELDYLYQNLRVLAPEATIVAIGYPHLVSATNPDCSLNSLGLTQDVRQMFNQVVDAGNAQIKATAANLGIPAITDEIATKFNNHEVCSNDEWIVSLEQILTFDPLDIARAGHPNDAGHRAIAEVVFSYLPRATTINTPWP